MIKQIKSSEIKNFISDNKEVELLDVRTQEEWDNIGKPDGEKLGLKTHFVTIVRSPDPSANKEFIEEVKKKTGKTPMQHALGYVENVNPNNKKEKCISFIEKTNSEACMVAKRQISLVQSAVSKKISNTRTIIKEKAQTVITKPVQVRVKVDSSIKSKKLTKEFFLALKTKIKEYDNRWLSRIEKSSLRQ